jgi:carboxyl-terminal processing protease
MKKWFKSQIFGLFLVAVALLTGLYITFCSSERSGLRLMSDHGAPGSEGIGEDSSGGRSLPALYRTINYVQKFYIDAARIDARAMFLAALRTIQGQVAMVLVKEHGDEVIVRLDNEEKRFDLRPVETPWALLQKMREVFDFLSARLSSDEVDFKELEYSAVNGMLSTLDPHSVLLSPDVYRDMKDKTRGKFGGLGIVISIRDGALTIISPLDGTPADRAGLKAGDQITKIGEASTVNMALNDAVDMLRGDPGTKVTLSILRKGWDEPKEFTLERAIVKVESIESHKLGGRIGYVRVKDFQGNTADDLREHLEKLGGNSLKGLVLDLRSNPGGLLEAAIDIADIFVESGVIVTTAGQGPAERDVRRAKDDGVEPTYPVVVLVDPGSASASEIVAGALKNLGRALLVGERTFGKGSVQVLYDYNDGSALKLTTAQYLTPGDLSIQSVGVVPHLELRPLRADKEMIDLVSETAYRESDLEGHFASAAAPSTADAPVHSLGYLYVPEKDSDGQGPADQDTDAPPPIPEKKEFEPDYPILLAERLLSTAPLRSNAKGLELQGLRDFVNAESAREEERLGAALGQLGVDWRKAPSKQSGESKASVTARLLDPEPLVPGSKAKVAVTVFNDGPGTLYQVHATTRSDFRPLADRELAFGKIASGQSAERLFELKVPKDTPAQVNDVRIDITVDGDRRVPPLALRIAIGGTPRPRFAFGYQLIDDKNGNGDGLLQQGEEIALVVDIENVGAGSSQKTYAALRSLSGDKMFMTAGRAELGEQPAGSRKRAVFTFELKPGFEEDRVKLELTLADLDLRVYTTEKLLIPVTRPIGVFPSSGEVCTGAQVTPAYADPGPSSLAISRIPPGTELMSDAQSDGYVRVRLDDLRFGWLRKSDTGPACDAPKREVPMLVAAPPALELEDLEGTTRSATVRLRGQAVDDQNVRDIYVFSGEDKVFYKSGKGSKDQKRVPFETELPLKEGLNYVAVVAEESSMLDSREVITIRRDRSDGMPFLMARTMKGPAEPLGVLPRRGCAFAGFGEDRCATSLATPAPVPPPANGFPTAR